MEIAETVAIGIVSEFKKECPFPHKEPAKVQNDLTKDSGKLGTALKDGISTILWDEKPDGEFVPKQNRKICNEQPKTAVYPDSPGYLPKEKKRAEVEFPEIGETRKLPYTAAAHHLIPTNGSLTKAKALMVYIAEKDGKISGDIGYDTNGAENGVWLPTGNSLARVLRRGYTLPTVTKGTKYGKLPTDLKQRYAEAVMRKVNRQFHDAHGKYNDFVMDVLGKIHNHAFSLESDLPCKECKKIQENKGKVKPPHGLVMRLNSLNDRLKGKLANNPLSWRWPIFTSSYAMRYWESVGAPGGKPS